MASALAWLRRRAFGVSERKVLVPLDAAGVAPGPGRERLEQIVSAFMAGYRSALDEWQPDPLARRLDDVAAPLRGFAYEGAAMAIQLTDGFARGAARRWEAFARGPAAPHAYMAHVGAGWALARLPQPLGRALERFDPLLRWLVVDGYGFHQGYFQQRRFHRGRERPALGGYAARAFDQGLGRVLWFLAGTDPEPAAAAVEAHDADRRPDLWSGLGLACAYAGGVAPDAAERLRERAGAAAPHFAQGVSFAVAARARAGNPAAHTDRVCERVWGLPAGEVDGRVERALAALGAGADAADYERWRAALRDEFRAGARS